MNEILKCHACGRYTLERKCPICSADTRQVRPAKFSEIDKYASYRREAKAGERKEKGLL